MSTLVNEIKKFLSSCQSVLDTSQSTEHSYRKSLEELLNSVNPKLKSLNEPKRQKVGAPDFIIFDKNIQIAFVEAKDIKENLKDPKHKDQITRYQALGNLCFTNNLDWQFYDGTKLLCEVKIASIEEGKIITDESKLLILSSYLQEFLSRKSITINSSKQLAIIMANKARTMSQIISKIINEDNSNNETSELVTEFNSFKKYLIHDLNVDTFADIYSQTVTYGLFTARFYDDSLDTFTRHEAASSLPKSNPFLRNLFNNIAGPNLDNRFAWVVDNLVDAFAHADVNKLMKDFGKNTQMSDPVLHFYETFLGEYDPKARKATGVYYTPDPVVKFIVNSVDEILKTEFNLPMGLADNSKVKKEITSEQANNTNNVIREGTGRGTKFYQEYHKVQILDPATGTGTFLLEVFKKIHSKFINNQGIWQSYASKDLLPRVHGFELLMASYSMAHLKLSMYLTETGVKIDDKDRLSVYLTNSLEESENTSYDLFSQWLSKESQEASRIKNEKPVMVIIGNPPYSGESNNKSEYIMKLMEDYKLEPGGKEKLKERNPKWINDDYVKFIRYAQSFVEKNNEGIVAFINPHGYLDNPTFRGVRWNLLKTYDKLYIIDLHGNSKKKEKSPDGSKDENVFDIQQGVSINIFVKTNKKNKDELAQIFHYDIFGLRKNKYEFLKNNSLSSVKYNSINPKQPMYYMVQKNFELELKYEKGISISDLMTRNNVGIVTARDEFTIHFTSTLLKQTIDKFLLLDDDKARSFFKLRKDVRDWKVSFARNDIKLNYSELNIVKISYRPFDLRYTLYTGNSKGFHCYPRNEVMQNFIGFENLGLTVCKQFKSGEIYYHVFITSSIIESSFVSNKTSEITSVFPIYIKDDSSYNVNFDKEILDKIQTLLELEMSLDCEKFYSFLSTKGSVFSPTDLIDYIYAVLHSPNYREKYKEFLKIDFPRIPFDVTQSQFWQLVELGTKLRKLHLMEDIDILNCTTNYNISGDNIVTKFKYLDNSVYINDSQYFGNVSEVAFNFFIGGYQPAQKWLKDRKGRELSYEDITHYQKIIYILNQTSELMKEIDKVDFVK